MSPISAFGSIVSVDLSPGASCSHLSDNGLDDRCGLILAGVSCFSCQWHCELCVSLDRRVSILPSLYGIYKRGTRSEDKVVPRAYSSHKIGLIYRS